MAIKFDGATGKSGLGFIQRAQSDREDSMRKLATGLRILSAADDAAGLAIASEMSANLRSLSQATRNVNDGVSLTQTADGALGEIGGMLGRMRELAMQASNGTLNDDQRALIDDEYQQLKQEIDRVSATTEFNGKRLLDGSESSLEIQAGTDPEASGRVSIDLTATDAAALGVAASSVGNSSSARDGLQSIDDAIRGLSQRRVDLGAVQNRLGSALSNLSTRAINVEDARSRIEDADIAREVSNQITASIRSQASVAVQAQVQQQSSQVLSLL